jgi:NAD(P)-dependent dehydrogenase (short-subunit alcohol dehydrogenase family)
MTTKVLVTGAAHGIGQATALAFRKAGCYVIGIDKSFSAVSNDIDRFFQVDLSDPKAVKNIFDQLVTEERELHALINNAAVQLVKSLVETKPEEWDALMAVNVRAAYLSTKYAFPLMRNKGGSIVNVASVHAVATSKGLAAYASSKGALVAMTRAAALELAEYKIRVNAILPGAVDTEMLRAGLARDLDAGDTDITRLQSFCKKQPLGRIGRPDEIANAILFLADGKKSAFISGQTLVVDGGATARLSTE